MPEAPPPLPKPARAARRWLPWLARRLVCLLACAAATASVFAYCDQQHWSARMVTPFRPQLMLLGVATAATAWRLRCSWFTRAVALAAITANLWVIGPWVIPHGDARLDTTFSLMSWNTWSQHPAVPDVLSVVRDSGADVVLLCELPSKLRQPPAMEIEGYQCRVIGEYAVAVRDDCPVELISASRALPPYCLQAVVRFQGHDLRLLSMHTTRPTKEWGCKVQDRHMHYLGKWFEAVKGPTIITGDFNQTPWCPRFHEFVNRTGLHDTSLQRGLTYTYPGDVPVVGRLIGIPIDQCLLTPDLACSATWVGDAAGSNHRPVWAEIGFAPQ